MAKRAWDFLAFRTTACAQICLLDTVGNGNPDVEMRLKSPRLLLHPMSIMFANLVGSNVHAGPSVAQLSR